MPPSEAMAPICVRTRVLISWKRCAGGVAGSGLSCSVLLLPWCSFLGCTNAKGRWPLTGSGMPITLASLISGWDRMACSMAPDLFVVSLFFPPYT